MKILMKLSLEDMQLISLALGDEAIGQEKHLKKLGMFNTISPAMRDLQHRLNRFKQEFRMAGLPDENIWIVNEQ